MDAAQNAGNPKRLQPSRRIADEFAQHPLVANRIFYTLPSELLLNLRARGLALHELDPGLYRLERVLTYVTTKRHRAIGTWNCQTVDYRFLSPPEPITSLGDYARREFGDDPSWKPFIDRLDENLLSGEKLTTKLRESTLGYCGWLMVNSTFIEEHDRFFKNWRSMIIQYGLPVRGPLPDGIERWLLGAHPPPNEARRYAEAYGHFLDRWQLDRIRAPYLPEPMEIQFPALLPYQTQHLTRSGGQLMYLPGSLPIPDRDMLRDMIGSAASNQSVPPHLLEWHTMIRADNNAKNRIARFARLFRLQHYWAALQKRWQERLDGRVEKIQLAFAAWLLPDKFAPYQGVDTIRKDLRFISRRRGGTRWYRMCNAVDLF